MNTFLESMGLKLAFILAGFLGGIASVLYRGEKSLTRASALVFSGTITTAYTTPLVVDKFSLSAGSSYGAAFIVGILGMYIVGGIITFGEALKKDPLIALKRLFNLNSNSNDQE